MAEAQSSKVPQARSVIWNHYRRSVQTSAAGVSKQVAKCLYCETYGHDMELLITKLFIRLKFGSTSASYSQGPRANISTGNLWYHIEKKHPEKLATNRATNSINPKFIDDARIKMFKWIVLTDKPFDVAEDLNFQSFLHSVNPNCSIVADSLVLSAKTIKSELLKLHKEEELKVSNSFQVLAITMDNASNNDTFTKEFEKRSETLGLRFNAKNRIRCVAHVLHLSVCAILDHLKSTPKHDNEADYGPEDEEIILVDTTTIGSTVAKIRSIVLKIRLSNLKEEKLRQINLSNGLGDVKVTLDVKTRWNSTYFMLERALRLKPSLQTIIQNDPELQSFDITETEWDSIEHFVNVLKSFTVATQRISAAKNPTISLVMPIYHWLFKNLETAIDESNGPLKEACKLAQKKMKNYEELSNTAATWIAVVLDPTLKLDFFKEKYSKAKLKDVKETVLSVYNEHYDNRNENMADVDNEGVDVLYAIYPKRPKKLVKGTELLKYLKDDLLPPQTNILEWWKANEVSYPTVSRMAKDYLCIQGSSVAAERSFSGGANLVAPKRGSLKPDTISAMMCLKSWWS